MTRLQLKKPNKYLSFLTRSKVCSQTATSSKTLHAFSRGRRFRRIRGAPCHKFACAKKIHPPYDCRLYTDDTKIQLRKGLASSYQRCDNKNMRGAWTPFQQSEQPNDILLYRLELFGDTCCNPRSRGIFNKCMSLESTYCASFLQRLEVYERFETSSSGDPYFRKILGTLMQWPLHFCCCSLCSIAFSYWFLKFNYCV